MSSTDESRVPFDSRALVRACSVVTLAITLLAFAGWQLDLPWLRNLGLSAVGMNPLTALGLLFACAALWLSRPAAASPRLARVLAVIATALGASRLLSMVTGDAIQVDEILFRSRLLGLAFSNRMASTTALALTLAGLGLVGLHARHERVRVLSRACSIGALAIAWFALVGYAYGASNLSRAFSGPPMAFNSGLGLLSIAIGTLFARPDRGICRLLLSNSSGGTLSRRVVPSALAVPIVIGWLWLWGQRLGLYDAELGAALVVVATGVTLIALVWRTARDLDAVDLERRRVEAALQASLARVNCIVQSKIAGVITGTVDGWIHEANDAYLEMTERTHDDLPFRWDVTRPAELRPGDAAAMAEVLSRGASLPRETEVVTKGGRRIPVLAGLAALPGERGMFVAVILDLTSRKRAEAEVQRMHETVRAHAEQLEIANQELESFSYSVSHDLRAPLRHIDGFADLLRQHLGDSTDEKTGRYLDVISKAVKSMGALIDDLLVFSRMGRSEMQQTTVELEPLVNDVRRELENDVTGRRIAWRIDSLPAVQADPAMLKLVFTNLLSNAIKYTRPRTEAKIEIGATETDGETIVRVRDNGVGFDMEHVDKLFGVFQRLHRQDEFEGTGIGLANVQRIVRRHGGRVWAEAQPDRGASFFFALPKLDQVVACTQEAA